MPRKSIGIESPWANVKTDLADKLAAELKSNHAFGQPLIYEQQFPTGKIRSLVIWDEWQGKSLEDRTTTILAAYERAEGKGYREKVALASGLTVPEAFGAGMLPYHVFPALRKSDPVSAEDCRRAMIDEGATTLMGPGNIQLRLATEEEAEAARQRLIQRVPKTDEVWLISKEFAAHEYGAFGEEFQNGGAA
jgi:hypothetical protein